MKTLIINNKPIRNYTDDFISENTDLVKDWEFAPLYDGNFINPLWNGTEYIENATAEEIAEIENQKIKEYRHKIYDKTESLLKSALERSLGKDGQGLSLIQLENLQKIYENKKIDAGNILADLPINDISLSLLNYEIDRDFSNGKLDATINFINSNYNAGIDVNLSPIKKYASLILFKYNSGKAMFENFKAMVENFRSKLLTNLDYKEFSIIDARFDIVNEINNETTLEQIIVINNKFNAL
jgi:hypothetical protein